MIQENLEMNMKILKAGFGSGETIRKENVFFVFFIATKQKNLIFFLFFPLLFPRYKQSWKSYKKSQNFFAGLTGDDSKNFK